MFIIFVIGDKSDILPSFINLNIFDHFLCAFRKGHGCQTTLLRLLEDWKQALDCNEYIAAILMDLLKAFDCLPMFNKIKYIIYEYIKRQRAEN
jgi:hypothetical protein